ncbi:MAG: sialate O-acetylesterase [Siphonobacter sp.]
MKPFYYNIFFCIVCLPFIVNAQVTITFPTTRAVFQRDVNNQASLYIAGTYTQCITELKACLIPISEGGTVGPNAGVSTGWETIQTNPSGGNFHGTITGKGGWYTLKVVGLYNNQTVGDTAVLDKVGIGEVFVIAGQSNATGVDDPINNPGPSAGYDQVNTVAIGYKTILPEPDRNDPTTWGPWAYTVLNDRVAHPNFVHLDSATHMAPFGITAWCWGALGDTLVKRWKVPVAFFQGGWPGTSSNNWAVSTDPDSASSSPYCSCLVYPNGQPYGNFRIALNNYAAQFGIRAVLLHQGESDNQIQTPAATYTSRWNTVINASRSHTGKSNLAWFISRASMTAYVTSPDVIQGQNDLVNASNYTYAGPATDVLTGDTIRSTDGTHITGVGHRYLAKLWMDALDAANASTQITPFSAIIPAEVTATCAGNALTLSSPGDWSSYRWTDVNTNYGVNIVATGQTTTLSQGDYRLRVTDASSNVILSPSVSIPAEIPSVTATATSNSPLSAGSTLQLTASGGCYYTWSGPGDFTETTQAPSIPDITTEGTYTVTATNLYGCTGQASTTTTLITTFESAQTGSWDQPSTWTSNCANCLPTARTNVLINTNHSVTIPSGSFQARQLTLNGGLNFSTSSSILTLNP